MSNSALSTSKASSIQQNRRHAAAGNICASAVGFAYLPLDLRTGRNARLPFRTFPRAEGETLGWPAIQTEIIRHEVRPFSMGAIRSIWWLSAWLWLALLYLGAWERLTPIRVEWLAGPKVGQSVDAACR